MNTRQLPAMAGGVFSPNQHGANPAPLIKEKHRGTMGDRPAGQAKDIGGLSYILINEGRDTMWMCACDCSIKERPGGKLPPGLFAAVSGNKNDSEPVYGTTMIFRASSSDIFPAKNESRA